MYKQLYEENIKAEEQAKNLSKKLQVFFPFIFFFSFFFLFLLMEKTYIIGRVLIKNVSSSDKIV